MGRLSEYFRYLQTLPEELTNFNFTKSYVNITEEDKRLRREMKLYKKKK